MVPDNKNNVDPTVQAIVEMFPEDFLRNTARETGVVERERKIDVVILFWVTTLGFGVRFLSTIRGLKRKYEEKAKTTLSISSFYDRFTPEMVDFLRECVLHAIEFQAQQTGRILDAKLKRFKDLSKIARLSGCINLLRRYGLLQERKKSLLALKSHVSLVLLPIVLNP
jgi:hypothetical protein